MISYSSENVKRIIFLVVMVICVRQILDFVGRWMHVPPPTTLTQQITSSRNEPMIVEFKAESVPGSSWSITSQKTRYWAPYYLNFSSSDGDVEIYIVPCSTHLLKGRKELAELTDQFASGQVPAGTISRSSGDKGRVYIQNRWQMWGSYKLTSHAVFARSTKDTHLTLEVHYWR